MVTINVNNDSPLSSSLFHWESLPGQHQYLPNRILALDSTCTLLSNSIPALELHSIYRRVSVHTKTNGHEEDDQNPLDGYGNDSSTY